MECRNFSELVCLFNSFCEGNWRRYWKHGTPDHDGVFCDQVKFVQDMK